MICRNSLFLELIPFLSGLKSSKVKKIFKKRFKRFYLFMFWTIILDSVSSIIPVKAMKTPIMEINPATTVGARLLL